MTTLAIITEDNEVTYSNYTGSGPLAFTFPYSQKEDLNVDVDGVTISRTLWDDTPNAVDGGNDGGSIVLTVPVANKNVRIWRDMVRLRASQFSVGGASARQIDTELNRLVLMAQDRARNEADAGYTQGEVNALLAEKQDRTAGVRFIEEWLDPDAADDTQAVRAAIEACAATGELLDWGGDRGVEVVITEGLNYDNVPGIYNWKNPRIAGAAVPVSGSSISPKVTIAGPPLGSVILLTANANAKATQIEVASTLTVGKTYIIQSNGPANGDGVTKRAERITIRSLASGTTYNLEEPLRSSYTTGHQARVQLFDTDSVQFKCQGTFRLKGDPASTSINDYGLALVRLHQAQLEAFHGSDIASCHLLVDLCIDSDICSDWGWFERAKNTGQGYGLELAGGFGIRQGDLWGKDLRHVRTRSHSTGSTGHGAIGNLLQRDMIAKSITGDDMRSAADDSHAGSCGVIVGDCITNIAAGVTVPEAFVVEDAKAKYGRIIVNGADVTNLVIQSHGHPDEDDNYVEIESFSGTKVGTSDDWAGYIANRSGENGHTSQPLYFRSDKIALKSAGRGLTLRPISGDIIFNCDLLSVSADQGQALYVETSADYTVTGTITVADLDDGDGSTDDLVYFNGSAHSSHAGELTVQSGKVVKTGASGALWRANKAAIEVGPLVRETAGAGGTVTLANGGTVRRKVGEVLTASLAEGSATSITTNTTTNLASLSLPPGTWLLTGQTAYKPAATTSITRLWGAIGTTSATLPASGALDGVQAQLIGAEFVPGAITICVATGQARLVLTSTTTVYLMARATFTVDTMTAFGRMIATRIA